MKKTLMKVGFVGSRSMVGSVLIKRMEEEKDFSEIETYFFSTSQGGEKIPPKIEKIAANNEKIFYDADDLTQLSQMDAILTCQGSEWTEKIQGKLQKEGWNGYWIDAASSLRMNAESVIVLDPINGDLIKKSLKEGKKIFCGGNCTTAILLMGIDGLLRKNLIKSISFMSYQSASGAGVKQIEALMAQMRIITQTYDDLKKKAEKSDKNEIEVQLQLNKMIKEENLLASATKKHPHPLAVNVLPWIDSEAKDVQGQSKEEKKTMEEANKILGIEDPDEKITIDGICVRVPVIQCHSEALAISLKKEIDEKEMKEILKSGNKYIKIIDNNKEETLKNLNPIAVMGSLDVHVGRIRKMKTNPKQFCVFIVADQLMWGAAEPLRRILRIIVQSEKENKGSGG